MPQGRRRKLVKSSKYLAKWLVVILLMAIGIGTYAALSLSDKQSSAPAEDPAAGTEQEDAQQASPSSYLSNQRKHDIDMDDLSVLMGDYQDEAGEWTLSIKDDFEEKGPYLAVSRSDSGDKGFEGRIMYLQKDLVIVEIDHDRYKEMPEGWKLESDDNYAILDCVSKDGNVELGYRGNNRLFIAGF